MYFYLGSHIYTTITSTLSLHYRSLIRDRGVQTVYKANFISDTRPLPKQRHMNNNGVLSWVGSAGSSLESRSCLTSKLVVSIESSKECQRKEETAATYL